MILEDAYGNTPAIIIAHGRVGEILGKTVHGILMHSRLFNVLAVVDRDKAGQDTSKICPGVTRQVPIYAAVPETMVYRPRVAILVGDPSDENMEELTYCICQGLDIISSSFRFINQVPALATLARQYGVQLWDLRDVKRIWPMADGRITNISAKVVYVTGTDCGLGKRTAAFELTLEARRQGIKAAFAATGQTGLMLGCERGIVFDAIRTNFAGGAVEELIVELDRQQFDLIFLEGQASLMHFGFSSVLTLLHASNPHAIVLVHDPSREYHVIYGNSPVFKMTNLQREIELIESLYLPGGNPYKVVAVPSWGEHNLEKVKKLTSLPVADVRKPGGPAIILDAVLRHLETTYKWGN